MNIKIILTLVFSYTIIITKCIGGFIKVPKNINSFPLNRSYRALYDELTKNYSKDSILIKQVSSIQKKFH